MTLPTRDELVQRFINTFLGRVPDGDKSDPQLIADASVTADMLLPAYANQRVLGSNSVLEDATGAAALQWGDREGVGPKLGASGASGFVIISASLGGATFANGAELVDSDTGLRYALQLTTSTKLFNDGDVAPVLAVDTGPQTNVAGGKQLTWDSAPGGSGPAATVFTNSDGSGLTDGRDAETDAQYVLRIRAEKADRSKSANDADYRRTAKDTPGVRVLEAFTYPCINGTGTTALVCILPPAQPGGSRVPSEAQRILIETYVTGLMPEDDGCFFPIALEQQVDVAYQISWVSEASGWADLVPWPKYHAIGGTPGGVVVSAATDATHFVLSASNYTGIEQPFPGQTICFFNKASGKFSQKRLLSIGGGGPWTIVADTTNNASDTTYVPVVGQRAMPWSESLPLLLPTLLSYFDSIGPGEMTATFYDAGRRKRRQPQPPREWPNILTTKGLEDAIDIDQVHDRIVLEGSGQATTVGTPGTIVYLMRLRSAAFFAL